MPALSDLARIDHGLGGMLRFADGTFREFHIEASALRSRLLDRRMPGAAQARELPVGSAAEAEILAALDQWLAATFSPEQQKELLAPVRLPTPRTQAQDDSNKLAELLRVVRNYQAVTHPRLDHVFAGRGTVSLSLELQLGDEPRQQLLWRRIGDDQFARLYRDTATEPVPIDSPAEGKLMLGIANWLAARLGSPAGLWQPEPANLADDVRLVLRAWRGYREATSPRLRSAGTIMDGARGGSQLFEISDAQDRVLSVRFDHADGTKTPGRLREGPGRDAALVEPGTPREDELLGILQRAAGLRRSWQAGGAAPDRQLQILESELEKYRASFPADRQRK